MAKIVRPILVLPICLILGWLSDLLFWGKPVGISFPIFVFLLLVGGFWMARRAGLKPSRTTLWLLVPILFLASVSALRAEPFTIFTTRLVTVLLLGLFSLSFLSAEWTRYGFIDYVAKLLGLVPLGLGSWIESRPKQLAKARNSFWSRTAPILRGLLFALPLLLFLGFLLSSADPYFGDWMGSLFVDFQNLPEYIVRLLIVLLVAYILLAAYMFAFNRSRKQKLIGANGAAISIGLGWGEAITVLSAVIVLFAAFVAIQFRYFFGGLANVVQGPAGFTFAEYARRGFGELVVVAVTALGLFIILSAITKRTKGSQQSWFSGLGITLFALVAVILASAFERLLLLEEAYGFTRLRTYPHVFMVWLGILLLAVVLLEAFGRQRAFALATMLAIVGFTATLPILNVDAFIASTNIQRATLRQPLDAQYLASLSSDAIPVMLANYEDEPTSNLQNALACYKKLNTQATKAWQGWNLSAVLADQQLEGVTITSPETLDCPLRSFD